MPARPVRQAEVESFVRTGIPAASYLYLRHRWPVRLTHWLNVLALTVLLMSGLMIFNAHPALDWGKSSYTGKPSFFEIGARSASDGTRATLPRATKLPPQRRVQRPKSRIARRQFAHLCGIGLKALLNRRCRADVGQIAADCQPSQPGCTERCSEVAAGVGL